MINNPLLTRAKKNILHTNIFFKEKMIIEKNSVSLQGFS
jgi:hypothetical protein